MTSNIEPGGARTIVPTAPARPTLTAWAIFGGVMLCLLGAINVVHGITALSYDELLVNEYLYDNLTFWGWAFLIWGVLQAVAGVLTLVGNDSGPAVGMVLGTISAIGWFFMVFAAPIPAVVGVTLSIAIVASLATAYSE